MTAGDASGSPAIPAPSAGACNYLNQVGEHRSFFTVQQSPPTLDGGAITDGTWAQSGLVAYVPSMPAGSPYNDWDGDTYRLHGNTYEWVLGDPDFHQSRESGTFTTDGNIITFQPTCSSVDASRDPSPTLAPRKLQYAATATTLTLIDVQHTPEVVQTLTKQ